MGKVAIAVIVLLTVLLGIYFFQAGKYNGPNPWGETHEKQTLKPNEWQPSDVNPNLR